MADLTQEILDDLYGQVERDVYLENGAIRGRPATIGQRVGFPGTDRAKTDEERLRDLRQAALLERLGQMSTPGQVMRAGAIPLGERLGEYQTNKGGYRDRLNSDFEYVGFIGPGSALHTAGTWMSSVPGMVYAIGEMAGQDLGHQVERAMSPAGTRFARPGAADRNPNADEDLRKAAATFAAPVTSLSMRGVPDDHSYWAEQRAVRQRAADARRDWRDLGSDIVDPVAKALEVQKMPTQGDKYWERWGAPRPLAMAAGLVTDTMMDPFSAAGPALNLARAARALPVAERARELQRARRMLGSDYVVGGGLTGYAAIDELLNDRQ